MKGPYGWMLLLYLDLCHKQKDHMILWFHVAMMMLLQIDVTRIVFLRKNRCLPPFDVKSMSH